MSESRAAPSTYQWMVVFLLSIVYACAFIDRQILSLLAGHLHRDLAIGDFEIGLLQGPAFGLKPVTLLLVAA